VVRTRGEITDRRPRATAGRAKRKIPDTASLIVESDSDAVEPTAYGEPSSGGCTKTQPIRGPPMPALALTVRQFCQTHQLSESMFYKLKAQGRGPQEMAYGRRRAISLEAAARWRAAREAEATATEAAE
jgi:predicted DNA-binding transcriptional regulator AlpA